MRQFSLLDQIEGRLKSHPFPAPQNLGLMARGFEDWAAVIASTEYAHLQAATEQPGGKALLATLFGNSPYLARCVIRDPSFFACMVSQTLEATFAEAIEDMEYSRHATDSVNDLMAFLRCKKQHISLLTAIADLSGLWNLDQITNGLSEFAERSTQLSVSYLLAEQATAGNIELPWQTNSDVTDPAVRSGFTVLAMGKLGGRELNYSSDIDLIILYDDENMRYTGSRSLGECMGRLTQELVRILQKRTADGYVFRTDLRLRPDPRATPPALSISAAELYYKSTGLNWERAAMIKARPIAGDLGAGNNFLDRISQFIWRKHLDFAAVQDIHAIKHQIHRHHDHGEISVMGHDVKLGRGGIREIEFIAQAHQLISGGRDVRLRNRATCQVLQVLADTGHIVRDTADELITAYKFFRTLEHRIQMVNDEQKHVLPSSLPEVTHIAGFMGYADVEVFSAELLIHLRTVQRHYERVFEHNAPQDGGPIANIATDNDLDPKAIKTLEELGFKFPDQALITIQTWSRSPYRAMRYERARALLSELVGPLLAAASKTADPDAALRNFDGFLGLLPEGVQLFSLLRANPWLLNLLAEIIGSAPRLAALLGRNTGLLDGMLDTDFLSPLPSPAELSADFELKLEQARDYQDILDMSRTWANDHRFRVGIQVLRNTVSPNQASRSQSDLADVAIQILLPKVTAEFARQHGTFPGSEMCVLGLGKLGGREMTFTSDLDLVFIYNVDEDGQSDGPKPLFPSTYFARLSQRFINALAAPTGEGRLYEVDMRLRPSGRAGPIAQTTAGFAKYQHENAWTWEHMALTRARVITAGPQLKAEVESIIQSVLTASRLPGPLVADVAQMRAKMRQEFGTENIWMVKHAQGGMLDVEFIAQYLQLKYAAENSGILSANTGDCLDRLSDAGLLEPDQSHLLCSAFALYTGVQSLIRLCTEDSFDENNVPAGLQKALSDVCQTTDFESLKRLLQDTEAKVYRCFENLIVQSAACQPSAEGIQTQI